MLAVLLILFGLAPLADAAPQTAAVQTPKPGIFGRVTNSETHEVIRRAAIKVYTSKDQWDVLTDGDGKFRFPDLAPGEYGLVAHRDAYTDRAYVVERSDFVDQKELPIELYSQAVISGRVTNSLGAALQSAQIQALGVRTRGGQVEVLNSIATNDLGEYRLSGLDPGTYELRATYREGRENEFDPTPVSIATSYYGGSEKASQVTVKAGSAVGGVDFILNPVRPVTLKGALRTDAGMLRERTTLWINGKAGEGGHNGSGLADGTFEIQDVGPGTYTVSAETFSKTDPLFGVTTVDVRDVDVGSINITLKPIPKIAGELQMIGGTLADPVASVYFTRTDQIAMAGMQIAHPDADRRFTIPIIPGEYRLAFDDAINKAGVREVRLDGVQIVDWKVRIDDSPGTKKLVVVLGASQ